LKKKHVQWSSDTGEKRARQVWMETNVLWLVLLWQQQDNKSTQNSRVTLTP